MRTLSVIIPLYKGSRYINTITQMIDRNRDVLKSEKIQVNIEVIFINDYPEDCIESDDSSYVLINHQINKGIHKSRVDGLEISKGEYILFLDQDDSISDDYVASQMSILLDNDVDWVICNGIFRTNRIIYPNQEDVQNVLDENHYYRSLTEIISPGQVILKKNIVPLLWKKNILKNNFCDDAFLWILLKDTSAKLGYNSNIAYFHNEDGENTSFSWSNNANALKELEELVLREDCLTEYKRNAFLQTVENEIYKHETFAKLSEMFDAIFNIDLTNAIQTYATKKILIYGYGYWGRKLYDLLRLYSIKVEWIIDKNIKGNVKDIYVSNSINIDKEFLKNNEVLAVIATVYDKEEIIKLLVDKGINSYIFLTDFLNGLLIYSE